MKLAIVSPVLPPSQSGQAIVLFRLFEGVDPDQYIMISPMDYQHEIGRRDICSQKLSGKYYCIPQSHPKILNLYLKLNYYDIDLINQVYLKPRIKKFIKIFQDEKCSRVIACTADLIDPYCASIAAKKLNLPFFFYMFDDYIQQWTNKYYHDFAQKVGPSMIKNATGIIVPNEHLKNYCSMNFNVNAKIIHNPVNLSDYTSSFLPELEYTFKSEIRIVYTGAIYAAQSEALNRLVDAISNTQEWNIRLHIYSPNRLVTRKTNNEFVVHHDFLQLSIMPEIQKNAHILFLPLAFNSEYSQSLIDTSSPGKLGEYLASGRPIIVHSPPDSFVTWYFEQYNCGSVVDSDEVDILAKEIIRIISNEEYRRYLMENATVRAKIDFDLNKIRKHFFEIFL